MSESNAPVLAAIAKLGEELGSLRQEVGSLRQEVGTVREQVESLRSDFDARVGRVEDGLTRLRVDLMDRLDRQGDLLNLLRDDIGVNMAATERVKSLNSETRKDIDQISQQVSLIHRRLLQLEARVDAQSGRL